MVLPFLSQPVLEGSFSMLSASTVLLESLLHVWVARAAKNDLLDPICCWTSSFFCNVLAWSCRGWSWRGYCYITTLSLLFGSPLCQNCLGFWMSRWRCFSAAGIQVLVDWDFEAALGMTGWKIHSAALSPVTAWATGAPLSAWRGGGSDHAPPPAISRTVGRKESCEAAFESSPQDAPESPKWTSWGPGL